MTGGLVALLGVACGVSALVGLWAGVWVGVKWERSSTGDMRSAAASIIAAHNMNALHVARHRGAVHMVKGES